MIKWPNNKSFAFTIIDDTDNATIQNIKPVYDYLNSIGIKITKTLWVYEPKDNDKGNSLQNKEYSDFLFELKNKGFELAIHSVGSGEFKRNDIVAGYEIFKNTLGIYPKIHINHASNPDNIYWGHKRFSFALNSLFKNTYKRNRNFYGEQINSEYFWGDISKRNIKYIRNRVFNGINTLSYDPKMPFREKKKKYANYWFSSSDGHTRQEFNNLITPKKINKLLTEHGLCIVYTHFAFGFVESDGSINEEFKEKMNFLSKQDGWFAPASEILDFLLYNNKAEFVHSLYLFKLDIIWLIERIIKKLRYRK